jgi:hypothetical protein
MDFWFFVFVRVIVSFHVCACACCILLLLLLLLCTESKLIFGPPFSFYQGGQQGNQIGSKFWEVLSLNTSMSTSTKQLQDAMYHVPF